MFFFLLNRSYLYDKIFKTKTFKVEENLLETKSSKKYITKYNRKRQQ